MIFHAITSDTFTAFIDGKQYQTAVTPEKLRELNAAVADGDAEAIIRICSPEKALQAALASSHDPDVARVEIRNGQVYFDGYVVDNALTRRMLELNDEGFPMGPWIKFAANLFSNPNKAAIDEIFLWLETSDMPITPDGHFLAYKRVRENYTDVHTGTFDNSVGQVVEMPREEVDTDRRNTCSVGLHFCSQSYLPHFAPGGKVMVVKINPADVVSIPEDYSNAKGRTWRYEVVGEVDPDEVGLRVWSALDTDYSGAWDDDDDGYDPEEDFDDELADEEFDEDDDDEEDPFGLFDDDDDEIDLDEDDLIPTQDDTVEEAPRRSNIFGLFRRG